MLLHPDETPDALKYYNTALECDDGDAEYWFNKGVIPEKLSKAKDGKACIENAVNMATGSG